MRGWSIFAGRFLGVEFRIHITFLFLLMFVLLVMLGSLRAGIVVALAFLMAIGSAWWREGR